MSAFVYNLKCKIKPGRSFISVGFYSFYENQEALTACNRFDLSNDILSELVCLFRSS